MKLLRSYLVGNVKRMNDNNVRMEYIGRIQRAAERSPGHHAVGDRRRRRGTPAQR